MVATKFRFSFYILLILVLGLPIFANLDEDEISPETLPDELPQVTVVEEPKPEIESKQENLKTADADLANPIVPLFPTDPMNIEDNKTTEISRTEMDSELANPDPNYTAPVKSLAVAPKNEPKTSETQTTNAKEQPPTPKPNTQMSTALDSDLIITKVRRVLPPRVSTLKTKPKRNPKIPLVLAPPILAQVMAEAPRGIPIETFISKLVVPPVAPSRPPKGVSDVSIILANNEFFPAKIILKANSDIRLLFTTTNKKPAALVIEKLKIQRWVASSDEGKSTQELDRSGFEINRELSASRVTEIEFEPKPGVYGFHDVMTGASGEIIVEEQ